MTGVNLARSLQVALTYDLVNSEVILSSADSLFDLLNNFSTTHSDLIAAVEGSYGPQSSLYHINACLIDVLGSRRVILLINNLVLDKYKILAEAYASQDEQDDDEEDNSCCVPIVLEKLTNSSFHVLVQLNWHLYYKTVFVHALELVVEAKVLELCRNVYDERHVQVLYAWVESRILPFIQCIYYRAAATSPVDDVGADSCMEITLLMKQHVDLTLAKARSAEMFEIITEFPDSQPAIQELKEIFARLNASGSSTSSSSYSLHDVGIALRKILQRRLLHLGASTVQILDVYVTMIRALRELDPLDTLLNYVAVPLRKYLKQRPDTIRCIITSLIHDIVAAGGHNSDGSAASGGIGAGSGMDITGEALGVGGDTGTGAAGDGTIDLYNELKKGGKSLEYTADSDNEEGGPNVNGDPSSNNNSSSSGGKKALWLPRKRDKSAALHCQQQQQLSKSSYGMDIIALLVSIYGSMDVFVSEYRNLLSQRLLVTSPPHLHYLATNNLLAGVASGARVLYDRLVDGHTAINSTTASAPSPALTYSLSLFDLDTEVANLELLKIRFGEDSLNDCEIMLHDVEDSKRVNAAVCGELNRVCRDSLGNTTSSSASIPIAGSAQVSSNVVDCVIVSDNYWPRMPAATSGEDDDGDGYGAPPLTTPDSETDDAAAVLCINSSKKLGIHLHPIARTLLSIYQATYSVLKKPRRLIFVDDALGDFCRVEEGAAAVIGDTSGSVDAESPYVHMGSDLGFVELELCFNDNTVRTFTVSSVQASLVLYLSDLSEVGVDISEGTGGVTLSQLCEAMGVSPVTHATKTRQLMRFWVSQGVVIESRQTVYDDNTGVEVHSYFYRVIEEQSQHALNLGFSGLPEWLSDLQTTFNRRGGVESEVRGIDTCIQTYMWSYAACMLNIHVCLCEYADYLCIVAHV